MEKYLYFDLDGTLYNLYKIPGWLDRLRANDASVYNEAGYERKSLKKIRAVVSELQTQKWNVMVISWAGMGVKPSDSMFYQTCKAKENWCKKYLPEVPLWDIIISMYGIPKAKFATHYEHNNNEAIHVLVDDNKLVRAEWRKAGPNFYTINASRGFVKELQGLLG